MFIVKLICVMCMISAIIMGTTGIIEPYKAIMVMIFILFMYIMHKEK